MVLTVLLLGRRRGAEGLAASSAAMAWVALAEELTQRCFGLRISSNQCGVALRMRTWGQDGSGTTGGEKSKGGVTHRRSALDEIPAP